jgi:hypothetical protein
MADAAFRIRHRGSSRRKALEVRRAGILDEKERRARKLTMDEGLSKISLF